MTDCDTHTASEFDPQRKAPGVPANKINTAVAIPACSNAVRKYPNSARLIFQLGRAYAKKIDFGAAVAQYQRASDLGYPLAQNNLGVMYSEGQGITKDEAKAVLWYRKAAEQGLAPAQSNLAQMYELGRGTPQDYFQANAWYRKAAEQGFASAQINLGYLCLRGLGVEKNEAEAAKWFRKAADQGDANAQNNLGLLYELGRGVTQSHTEAVSWYRTAAEQGLAVAQYSLGSAYENGRGVPKDVETAMLWYRRAAEHGNEDARNRLAALVPAWRTVAVKQPAKPASPSDRSESTKTKLSPREIVVLRARIAQCWNVPAGDAAVQDINVQVQILLRADGSLSAEPRVLNQDNSPFFPILAKSALSAVRACAPFNFLPVAKYEAWKEIQITFNPGHIMEQREEIVEHEAAVAERLELEEKRGYKSISFRDFALDGKELAAAKAKITLSGLYVKEGEAESLFPSPTAVLLARRGLNTDDGIGLIVDDASRAIREVLLECRSDRSRMLSCGVTVVGRAAMCKRTTLVSSKDVPCLVVEDGWSVMSPR